jgi:hypothetical protein
VKKQVLGAVLVALLGLAGPAMSVGAAPVSSQSAQPGTLHIILLNTANTFDFWDSQDNGATFSLIATIPGAIPAHSVDVQVPAGNTHVVKACLTPSNSGCVANGQTATFALAGGGNDTVIGFGAPPGFAVFVNDTSATSAGKARFTINNDAAPATICVNGSPFGTNPLAPGTQFAGELAAQQNAGIAIVVPPGACPATPQFTLNFAAGTNTVFTMAPSANPAACTTACVQVLLVDQGRSVNAASTPSICAVLNPGLTGLQAEIKSVLGGVNVSSPPTGSNGNVQQLVTDIKAVLAAGDASVPATIQPQWEAVTAGLRQLVEGLTSAGFDLSKIPTASLQSIVDGANGKTASSQAVVAATSVLTSFFLANCVATVAAPKFTG